MPDPGGQYTIYVSGSSGPGSHGILEVHVDGAGNLINSTLYGDTVRGTYDNTTGKITFTIEVDPRVWLFVRHYLGYSILDDAGSVGALAGIVDMFTLAPVAGKHFIEKVEHAWYATVNLLR